MTEYTVIDLFAGAGGLSLGFSQKQEYRIVAAVEKNPSAQETYHANFPDVDIYGDIKEIDFGLLQKKYGKIDVVIGGPPCQGFSNANRQHNQTINMNNKLVKEYIRAIKELKPDAFVMENVGMLKSDVHRFYEEIGDAVDIDRFGITTENSEIFMLADKYKFSGVLDVVTSETKIKNNLWDEGCYKLMNIFYKQRKNRQKLENAIHRHGKSAAKLYLDSKMKMGDMETAIADIEKPLKELAVIGFNCQNKDELIELIERPLAIQRMLRSAIEIINNKLVISYSDNRDVVGHVRSFAVYDYVTHILGSDEYGYAIDNGILSATDFGVPQKRRRFVVLGVKKVKSAEITLPPATSNKQYTAENAIKDLEKVRPFNMVADDIGVSIPKQVRSHVKKLGQLRDASVIFNHIVPQTREAALERFAALKQGENFHSLSKELKENTYTNVERTQNTVYYRLMYKEPSGTVVNVRKSMWIHPVVNRAISVREAARLQTFPDSFRFYGRKDAQYQQVGNAVPPMLAGAIADHILKYLSK